MELKQFSEVSARASHEQNLFGFRQDEKYLSYSDTTFRCEFFSKLRFLIRAVNLWIGDSPNSAQLNFLHPPIPHKISCHFRAGGQILPNAFCRKIKPSSNWLSSPKHTVWVWICSTVKHLNCHGPDYNLILGCDKADNQLWHIQLSKSELSSFLPNSCERQLRTLPDEFSCCFEEHNTLKETEHRKR